MFLENFPGIIFRCQNTKYRVKNFLGNRGVRGLGKCLPVASSKMKKTGKARSVPKDHNGCPTLFFVKQNNRNAGAQFTD